MKSRPAPPAFDLASLRFHLRRAGGRRAFAILAGVPKRRVDRDAPQDETDAYHRGEMTSIGGLLVKKCSRCEVARQLESFHADSYNRSGCRPVCAICREKEDDSEYFNT
jgi:hypothetical protein